MHKKFLLYVLIFTCTATLFSCKKNTDRVSLDGSTSMEKTVGFLSEAYSSLNPGTNVTFNPTGSTAGIEAAIGKRCDMGVSTRYLTEDEKARGLKENIIAYDVIAVAVNPKNPINGLSLDMLGKIFKGEIASWDLLGWSGEIVVFGRETGSGTRDGFEAAINGRDECVYKREMTSGGDIAAAVAENPHSIGYLSVVSLPENGKIKAVSIDSIFPNDDKGIESGYALSRPFILVSSEENLSAKTEDFLTFAMSPEGARYIKMSGVSPAVGEK